MDFSSRSEGGRKRGSKKKPKRSVTMPETLPETGGDPMSSQSERGSRSRPSKVGSLMGKVGRLSFVRRTGEAAKGGVVGAAKGGAGLAGKGVGFAAKTAKGGAGLAAKTAKGGAGLAAKTAVGGAGLATKGVGLAAKTAVGGAGLAIGATGAVAGVAAGAAGGAVKTIQSGVGLEKSKSGAEVNKFVNELSIYASELYSVEFITNELKKVKDMQIVDVLDVEDLIIRGNEDLNKLMFNVLHKTVMTPTDQRPERTPKSKPPRYLDITATICGGDDLVACDTDVMGRDTSSDPYVIVKVVSDEDETIVGQTEHKLKTLNPTWNINLSKVISPKNFCSTEPFTVQFEIMDFDLVGDDDCMGVVSIPLEFEEGGSQKIVKMPKWHTVPVDSAPKAGGKLKVGVDCKLCFGEVVAETKTERHWRSLTFYENISSTDDYRYYTEKKKDFQSTVRKLLKKKEIVKFPVKFEAKIEIAMMDIDETIELLNLLGNDDTIVSYSIHDCDYDRATHRNDAGMEIKKLPKTLSRLFDQDTLEWKEDAEPVVICLKFGTKPPTPGKKRRSSLFGTCSQKLEQFAKKSTHFDVDGNMSFSYNAHHGSAVDFGMGSSLRT